MVNGKKLLASILVGAMVITGSPVAPAWSVASVEAAEKTVKRGEAYFTTIKEAIESTATGKITLTADISEEKVTVPSGTITLDLGGKTFTGDIVGDVDLIGEGTVNGNISTIDKNETNYEVVKGVTTYYCTKITETKKVKGIDVPVAYTVGKHELQASFDWTNAEVKDNKGNITSYDTNKKAKVTVTCNRGCEIGAKYGKDAKISSKTITSNDCSKEGKVEYTATYGSYYEKKEIITAKAAHSFTPVWDWDDDATNNTAKATVTFECNNCSAKIVKDATTRLYKTDEATCGDEGKLYFEGTVEGMNGETIVDLKEYIIPPTNNHVIKPAVIDKKVNYSLQWKGMTLKDGVLTLDSDATPKGSLTCEMVINKCPKCKKPLTENNVYHTFTVNAKDSKPAVHNTTEISGTVETYDKAYTETLSFIDNISNLSSSVRLTMPSVLDEDGKLIFNDAPEHRFIESKCDQWIPSCTGKGTVTGTCEDCGKTFTNKALLPKVDHAFDKSKKQTVKATCTTDGYIKYYCTTCHKYQAAETIAKTGHKFGVANPIPTQYVKDGKVTIATLTCINDNCGTTKATKAFNKTFTLSKLTKKDDSCQKRVEYTIPASMNNVTNTDITFTSSDEKGQHNYKAKFNWVEDSYKNPSVSVTVKCQTTNCTVEKSILAKDITLTTSEIFEGNCEQKAYKLVTATAKDEYGKTYTETKKLEDPNATTGNGHDYDDKEDNIVADFENNKLTLTCKTCKGTTTIDAVPSWNEAKTIQTLKGTIGKEVYSVSRTIKDLNIVNEIWVGKDRLENFDIPYFTYGVDPTNVVLYHKCQSDSTDVKLVKDIDYTVEIDSKNVGVRTVTVKGIGAYKGTKKYAVVIEPKAVTITLPNVQNTTNALPSGYKATVTGVVAGDNLNVKPVLAGSVIKATYDDNANYDVKVVNGEFTLEEPAPVEPETTELNLYAPIWGDDNRVDGIVTYFTYGADPTDAVLYTNVNGKKVKLVKDVDYTIEIDSKNAGTREVTVKGIGKYTGTDVFPVVIEKKAVTITLPSVSNTTNALPSGYKATVAGVVAGDDLNVKPVLAGTAIKATYDDNANYDVKVVEGKLTVVKPEPKVQSITTTKLTANYKVAAVKKAAKTFSIGAKCTSKATVTAKKVSGSKKITVSSTGKVKIAKGTKKGTYTAQVKLFAGATSSYKAATKTVKVTVRVK